ncbi:hypothetical protein [Sphingobacterium yanglingense]|uniref:Uncharacterized protein n=1 Tax=Sphingobacterium yanglingense TaxID=1437280 RepID=A0A4R6WL94_9SPHI|nr:hypothetical protein [Sphingobacterium yanglingense]TDQ79548.1 hypothetical protein CLV99_0991 [Sphingobacterium yanglingense]
MNSEIYTDIEMLEGFIKSEYVDNKINEDTAKELLRITIEIKEKIITD